MTITARRVTVLAFALLAALGAYLAVTVRGGAVDAHAAGTVQVHVKQASLGQGCGDQSIAGAHFVINQITSPPASITVHLSNGSSVVVPISHQVARVAHYTVSFASGLEVVDATAWVPADWTGQFVLSNYVCGMTSPSSPPVSSPPASGSPSN